jgi:hypothetical protein
MATYEQLRSLFGNSILRNRMEVACVLAAEEIRTEDAETGNHTNRIQWAKATFAAPRAAATEMITAVVAANATLSAEAIAGATDAQIQAQVDAAVDIFADGS